MVDLVNGLSPIFTEMVLASNMGGFFEEDLQRIEGKYDRRSVSIVTRAGIFRGVKLPRLQRKMIIGLLIAIEPILMLVNIAVFVRLLRKIRPNFVLSCNGGYPAAEATLALVLAARLCRLPVVLSIVSMPSERRPYVWPYDWSIDHAVWRSAEAVIVNAKLIAKALAQKRGADPRKLKVLYNGIEDVPVQPAETHPPLIVLGCVARLDRMKGVVVLLEAFAELAARHPSLRLVFAGQGEIDGAMVQLTKKLGLEGRVDYLGHYLGDISALLARFDIFVFPSFWEGFPYSIVEAMRSAKPIVATNVGGIPEAIEVGREGLLVEPASVSALVAAIESMIADPALRQSLGAAARRRFEQDLSLSRMHQRTRELLSESFEHAGE